MKVDAKKKNSYIGVQMVGDFGAAIEAVAMKNFKEVNGYVPHELWEAEHKSGKKLLFELTRLSKDGTKVFEGDWLVIDKAGKCEGVYTDSEFHKLFETGKAVKAKESSKV